MKRYPPVPHVDSAPEGLFESGHLWVQELIDGAQLRFRLRTSGRLEFGDSRRRFGDDPPEPYRHAVRHVRETLDREALRSAVDDVETVVFVGEATHRRTIDYEFGRMPSVLGLDVWDADRGAFLPPDGVERVLTVASPRRSYTRSTPSGGRNAPRSASQMSSPSTDGIRPNS